MLEEVMRAGKTLGMGVLAAAMALAAGAARANEKSNGALAFDQLKALVGEWEGKNAGGPVKITYTLVSGGTALMERMQPANEAEMITMYSADGDKIMVTHYCSEGNQPSMKSETLKGIANKYSFSLVSVSGLKSPDAGHMTGLVLTLVDKDHLKQEWTYWNKGKSSTDAFEFVRKPEKAATVVPGGN
ncbi:MAG TPA: hypothetical protein VKB24_07710 [Candidatus Acidoferrum sp.]|nr:hypothetical protein [Candidatus Acidoferrum sp.]